MSIRTAEPYVKFRFVSEKATKIGVNFHLFLDINLWPSSSQVLRQPAFTH